MDLNDFLRYHVSEDHEAPSHTSMVGGKWSIPKAEDDMFFEAYLESLGRGEARYFSERILPGCGFYFFLDLDFPSPETVEAIVGHNHLSGDVEFFRRLVEISIECLAMITENNIDAIFSKKELCSNKIHINFPTVFCDRKDIAVQALRAIQQSFEETFGIATSPELSILNWSKVFDGAPFSGGLRMPGSRKDGGDGPETAYRIFDLETEEFVPLTVDLLRRTTIRSEVRSSLQTAGMGVIYGGGQDGVPYAVLRDYVSHLREEHVFGDMPLSVHRYEHANDGVSFRVKLNDRRCPIKGDYHQRTSRVLYLLVSPTGCRMKCYDEFCKTQHSVLHPLTPAMRGVFENVAPLTLQVTDAEKYFFEKFGMRMSISDETRSLMKSLGSTDLQIAQVFYSIFKDRFCVTESGKDYQWYVFRGHKFVTGNPDARLGLMYIARTLYKLFIHEKFPDVYRSDPVPAGGAAVGGMDVDGEVGEADGADGDAEDGAANGIKDCLVKKARAIVTRLETMKSVNTILTAAGMLFHDCDPDVADKLDSARHLMAFANGVLDFSVPSQPIFRDGRFSDYLTLCSAVEFKYFNIGDPILAEVNQFFVSLFPNCEIREYVLTVLSKCLTASEIERLYILTGSGSNGKTKLVKLIMKAFGQYWRDMNVSVLTQKRKSSNAASPELVDLKGRHVVTTQEPDADERLNSGYVPPFLTYTYFPDYILSVVLTF